MERKTETEVQQKNKKWWMFNVSMRARMDGSHLRQPQIHASEIKRARNAAAKQWVT